MQFTGIDDFDKDFGAFLNTLIEEVGEASEKALDEARDTLREKIITEVYAKSIYTPTVYKRRSEKSGRGIPLSDVQAYSKIIPYAGGNINGTLQTTTRLYYNPRGEHTVSKWHSVDYNELIGRIEKKDPPYKWNPKNREIPPRPFWQHFIDEMVNQKELEKAFVFALKAKEKETITDGNIIEEQLDREY